MNTKLITTLSIAGLLLAACEKDKPVEPNYQSTTSQTNNTVGNGNNGNSGSDQPQTAELTVTPSNVIRLCPTWIGGDRDFGGIARVMAKVSLYAVNERELWSRVEFDVLEPNPDYTHANRVVTSRFYTAPYGWKIDAILSQATVLWEFTDQDHSEDVRNYSSTLSPVLTFRCKGDTGGNDVGNCTSDDSYLSVYYNPIQFRIKRL